MKYPTLSRVGGCYSGFKEREHMSIINVIAQHQAAVEAVEEELAHPAPRFRSMAIPFGGVDVKRSRLCSAHERTATMFKRTL